MDSTGSVCQNIQEPLTRDANLLRLLRVKTWLKYMKWFEHAKSWCTTMENWPVNIVYVMRHLLV